ncbi:MAG: hypothetical protein JNM85_07255 [Chthonomonas sp.]|nr:hypothetical protein [Chthonomonas sp.]
MRKNRGLIFGILLIGLAAVGFILMCSGPSDEELIRTALKDALTASREGRSGPVTDFVSTRATLDGEPAPGMGSVADFVRKSKPDIALTDEHLSITGDKAAIQANAKVKMQILLFNQTLELKDVRIEFERESVLKWGLLPSSKWKITKISTNEQVPRELMQ